MDRAGARADRRADAGRAAGARDRARRSCGASARGEDGERRLANMHKLMGWWRVGTQRRARPARISGRGRVPAGDGRPGGLWQARNDRRARCAGGGEAAADAVRLMSVHAAKGLEFDVVCVADLGRAPGMGVPDLLVQGRAVGVRLVGSQTPSRGPRWTMWSLRRAPRAQAEEEDRIVYVAMTRARERLLLSGAVDFASWPRERPGRAPIAWLGPALAPDLPVLCAEAAHQRAPALTVDGTDVPLRCRLNTPGRVPRAGLRPISPAIDAAAPRRLRYPRCSTCHQRRCRSDRRDSDRPVCGVCHPWPNHLHPPPIVTRTPPSGAALRPRAVRPGPRGGRARA